MVTESAARPAIKMKNEYEKPCLMSAITNAIGVDVPIGVKAIPTVRGKRKMPTKVRTPKDTRRLTRPEPKNELSSLVFVQAAPKYENRRPIPAINPITFLPLFFSVFLLSFLNFCLNSN
jgi:hypothetical protein